MIDGETMYMLVVLILAIFTGVGGAMYLLLSYLISKKAEKSAERISKHYSANAALGNGENYRIQYEKMVHVIELAKKDPKRKLDEVREFAKEESLVNEELRNDFLQASIDAIDQGLALTTDYNNDNMVIKTRCRLMRTQILNYTEPNFVDEDRFVEYAKDYAKFIKQHLTKFTIPETKGWIKKFKNRDSVKIIFD